MSTRSEKALIQHRRDKSTASMVSESECALLAPMLSEITHHLQRAWVCLRVLFLVVVCAGLQDRGRYHLLFIPIQRDLTYPILRLAC